MLVQKHFPEQAVTSQIPHPDVTSNTQRRQDERWGGDKQQLLSSSFASGKEAEMR